MAGDFHGHIVTVTANAALDRTLWLDATLVRGARQLVRDETCQAGGKGVNVARVLARLGAPVRTVVVLGGATGAAIDAELRDAALEPRVVAAEGESRTCTEILAEDDASITQLHGAGVRCTPAIERELLATIEHELDGAGWLALCGSLPRGLSDRFYASAIERAREHGVPAALDASGAALVHGVHAAPALVRVNSAEATTALGIGVGEPWVEAARAPAPAWWVVSDGPRKIWSWTADGERWDAIPPRVEVGNAIGCGDAMLAGLLFHAVHGRSKPESLRRAIALASADAESRCAGHTDIERARLLEAEVELQPA
jgi:tagatose 6-phosphate kinase